MTFRLAMNLGDQRAGRVDIDHLPAFRLCRDGFGDAVGGEDDRTVVRRFVKFVDEDRALGFQRFDDELVVDDFMPDIDRGAVPFQRLLDNQDGPVDAGAESARSGEQNRKLRQFRHVQVLDPRRPKIPSASAAATALSM